MVEARSTGSISTAAPHREHSGTPGCSAASNAWSRVSGGAPAGASPQSMVWMTPSLGPRPLPQLLQAQPECRLGPRISRTVDGFSRRSVRCAPADLPFGPSADQKEVLIGQSRSVHGSLSDPACSLRTGN